MWLVQGGFYDSQRQNTPLGKSVVFGINQMLKILLSIFISIFALAMAILTIAYVISTHYRIKFLKQILKDIFELDKDEN